MLRFLRRQYVLILKVSSLNSSFMIISSFIHKIFILRVLFILGYSHLQHFGEKRIFQLLLAFGFFLLFAMAIPYNYFDAKGSLTKACHHYSDSDLEIFMTYQVGMQKYSTIISGFLKVAFYTNWV
jgi:hypothetical protein